MKQKLIALCLAVLMLCPVTGFAVEEDRLFTEAYCYKAVLYYCDAPRNKIVLKNVIPIGTKNAENNRTALEATYNEIWISGSARLQNGGYVPQGELNFYADSNVEVVITRNQAEGLRVVAMRFR